MNRHPARELLSRVCRVTQFKISRGSEVKEGIKVEICLILQFGCWLTLKIAVFHIGYAPLTIRDPCLAVSCVTCLNSNLKLRKWIKYGGLTYP